MGNSAVYVGSLSICPLLHSTFALIWTCFRHLSVLGFCCRDETAHPRAAAGGKLPSLGSHFISEGSQVRKSVPWRYAAYWLAPHGFFSLISYAARDHLAPPTVGINQGSAPTGLFTVLWKTLLNCGSLFSANCSCQVDSKLPRIPCTAAELHVFNNC